MTASQYSDTDVIDLDEIGLTEEQWNEMSESEKDKTIQDYVIDKNEQPYWTMESFSEF